MRWAAEGGSLRQVLTLSYVFFLSVALVALGVGVYGLVDHHLWRAGQVQLIRQAIDGVTRLNPEVKRGRWTALRAPQPLRARARELAESVAEPRGFVRVYSAGGEVLAQVGPDLQLATPTPEATEYTVEVEGPEGPWQVRLMPLLGTSGVEGVLAVGGSYRSSRELLDLLRQYLLLVGAVTLLLVWGGSAWLAVRLSRPLEALSEAAREVAAGELATRSPVRRATTEVMRLSHSFDAMVERLEQSLLAQKRFVADASHELKTPLTSIGGMSEMLRRGAGDRTEDRELALTTIEREVDRMSRLVADLLALSRAEQAQPGPSEEVPLLGLLEEAARPARRTHRVTLDCPPQLKAWGRRDALSRVLQNLVDNAVKYTPQDKEIALTARADADGVEVRVADQGMGISPDDLEHVFERFYRADPARARGTGGTGLGLSIVAALVHSMEGSIRLDSRLGEGTTAVIRLPGA